MMNDGLEWSDQSTCYYNGCQDNQLPLRTDMAFVFCTLNMQI